MNPHPTGMSLALKGALAAALLLSGNFVFAHEKAAVHAAKAVRPRPLTRSEGAALAHYALAHVPPHRRPDCSHLVHELLTNAGLEYPYAPSNTIFAGLPQFVRVSTPQPGDLIVWPGHVGLVVDPREHMFLSSTRTGIRSKDYTTDYWRERGQPRFYRYLLVDNAERVRMAELVHSTR